MRSVGAAKFKIRLLLVVCAYLLVTAGQWLQRDLHDRMDAAFVDRLAALDPGTGGDAPAPRVPGAGDADPIVYIDANFYYDRSFHARVIQNLAALGTASQFVDFVFSENLGDENDQQLVEAVAAAGNVYFGISFGTLGHPTGEIRDEAGRSAVDYMDRTKWWVDFASPPDCFYVGRNSRMTASRLAAVSRGGGFLNLPADADGVLRSVPLLVRYRGALYPSLSLLAACDSLGVSPDRVRVAPGEAVILKGAGTSRGSPPPDIVIPIDECGRMLINFNAVQPPIPHYSYRDIFGAFEDPDAARRLKQELSGKIAILSENIEADIRIRPGAGQKQLTSGTVHAVIIRNILSQSFLCRLSETSGEVAELLLLAAVLGLSLVFSSIGLVLGTVGAAGAYLAGGVYAFSGMRTVVPFVGPLLMAGLACTLILGAMAVERAVLLTRTEKARQRAEHELEIGRRIQSGFFPASLPEADGWEIAAHFQPARHVSGDFYDLFSLENPRYVGMVVADVCDKGVGAALYMAIFRSLVRILCRAPEARDGGRRSGLDPARTLERTVRSVNDYIAVTHEREGMFATLFFGILDTETGELFYINGGHEPPLLLGEGGAGALLMPTGPAVGAYAGVPFMVKRIRIEPGETLLGYTDGVTDARNPAGALFTRERVSRCAAASAGDSPRRLVDLLNAEIDRFRAGTALFDDITLLAVGRRPPRIAPPLQASAVQK